MTVKEKVEKLRLRKKKYIEKIDLQIQDVYKECEHKYKFHDSANDHDGWSVNVEVNWTTWYKCEKCDHIKEEHSKGRE